MGHHELQAMSIRHQVTGCQAKTNKFRIDTWNARIFVEIRKLDNMVNEMDKMTGNILEMCEMKWKGSGKVITGESHNYISRKL